MPELFGVEYKKLKVVEIYSETIYSISDELTNDDMIDAAYTIAEVYLQCTTGRLGLNFTATEPIDSMDEYLKDTRDNKFRYTAPASAIFCVLGNAIIDKIEEAKCAKIREFLAPARRVDIKSARNV